MVNPPSSPCVAPSDDPVVQAAARPSAVDTPATTAARRSRDIGMEVILPKYPGLWPAQISVRHLNPRPAAALTATLLDLVAYAARVDRSAASRDAQQVLRQALAADGE